MKKLIYVVLWSCLFGVLTGCSNEPMIKLSKENQVRLENKRQQVAKKTPKKSSSPQASSTSSILNVEQWKKADTQVELSLSDFFPIQEYEIRQFSNGDQSKYLYMTHQDKEARTIQTVMIQGKQPHIQQWTWDDTGMIVTDMTTMIFPLVSASQLNMTGQNSRKWLQSPLKLENEWKSGNQKAKITGIYSQATIQDHSYKNVIEITCGKDKWYLAQNIGLIAELTQDTVWVMHQRQEKVKLISPVTIYLPDESQQTVLTTTPVDMEWQTNGSLAQSLTKLCQDQGWIGSDIVINKVDILEDMVQIDFSPGVVATLNAHPSGEQAVLSAIIANVSQWTQRDKVKITVNDYIMTPMTLQFPADGVYQYQAQWLEVFNPTPLINMGETESSQSETTATESTMMELTTTQPI